MVYCIRRGSEDIFKIGYTASKSPKSRIASLQTGSPEKLELFCHLKDASMEIEKNIHEELKDFRIGGEWFNIPEHQILSTFNRYQAVINCPVNVASENESKVLELIKKKVRKRYTKSQVNCLEALLPLQRAKGYNAFSIDDFLDMFPDMYHSPIKFEEEATRKLCEEILTDYPEMPLLKIKEMVGKAGKDFLSSIPSTPSSKKFFEKESYLKKQIPHSGDGGYSAKGFTMKKRLQVCYEYLKALCDLLEDTIDKLPD